MTQSDTLPPPGGPPSPPPGWVPADERIAGLDRRTIWPGVVLLAVWAVWAHLMPWIDDRIALDDPIVAGDVINLGNGEVTFAPAVGWQLESGLRLTEGDENKVSVPGTASLSSDTVLYSASSGGWDGTAEELLDQMIDVDDRLDRLVAADERGRSTITNADGVEGRLAYVAGADQSVLLATFVFERDGAAGGPIGVEIEARGEPQDLEDAAEEIASMIDSTTYRPGGEEADA